ALVGTAGSGWAQATAELSLERSGPERYLSSIVLVTELVRHAAATGDPAAVALVGKFASEAWTLRQMSLAVAGRMAMGEDPALEEAVIAARLAAEAGFKGPGFGTIAEKTEGSLEQGRFSGALRGVAWGRAAGFVVAPAPDGGAMILSAGDARIEQRGNVADEP